MSDPFFLTKEAVLAYHAQQIQLYGGDPGLRDPGLLESALAQPANTWLYLPNTDVFDVAAAYAFHLSKNHPFVDGNKRTALAASLGFLKQNRIEAEFEEDVLYNHMIALTEGGMDKTQFACVLFLHGTLGFFNLESSEMPEEIRRSFAANPNMTAEERKVIIIDASTSRARMIQATRCEELNINPKRFDEMLQQGEQHFFAMVPEQWKRQFGMNQ